MAFQSFRNKITVARINTQLDQDENGKLIYNSSEIASISGDVDDPNQPIVRVLRANLPTSRAAGTLIICTDTGELFMGTGTGIRPVTKNRYDGGTF